ACKCKICQLNTQSKYCAKRFQYGQKRDIRFSFERIGYSCKMNEMEAAIGLGNIDSYQDILDKRRENLKYLIDNFKKFEADLVTIEEAAYEKIGPHAFPIIVQEKAKFSREQLVIFLEEKGVDTRSLFSSMPTQCPGFEFLGYKLGDFPNAEYVGNNGLHIGVHQDLGKEHLDYFLKIVEEFINNKQEG
ncbi:MAG: DegT/DnrJ/EryC1/StrS family aminotransferase, partial [Candidatus Omnitrophica bacterium]|nr:DegT/DnrJ/EryC1/StrS family aminotransferase [Candidatus Omnitrophota bacterium]